MVSGKWLVPTLVLAIVASVFTVASARPGDERNHTPEAVAELLERARHLLGEGRMEAAEEVLSRAVDMELELRRHGRPGHERDVPLEAQIHHLMQAADNLEEAGMPEMARELRNRAEELHHEMRQREERHRERGPEHENLANHVEELTVGFHQMRRHVEELTEVVAELRERVEALEERRGRR